MKDISLPKYLHIDILKPIIDYLLTNNNKINYDNNNNNNNKYIIKNYYLYINEIIKLSLVSNHWYQIISNLIISNLISNNILEEWFNLFEEDLQEEEEEDFNKRINFILYRFNKIYDVCLTHSYFKMKVNQKYSIIKINQSIIKDYFRNQVLCIYDLTYEKLLQLSKLETEGNLKYRKIISKIFYTKDVFKNLFLEGGIAKGIEKNGLLDISSNKNNNNNNNNNIVELIVYDFLLENDAEEGFYNLLPKEDDEYGIYKDLQPILYLNTIDYEGSQDDYNEKTFRILEYLKSKNIKFRTTSVKNVHADFSLMFNNKINNQVESIRIDSDFVEPIDLQNVYELTNLHTLSIPLHFHQMILLQLGIEELHCRGGDLLEHTDNVMQDWDKMIQSLLASKSIKNFKIFNKCYLGECINQSIKSYNNENYSAASRQVKKLFSDGIKQLLSSSTFKYFKIYNMHDIISIDTFSELKNNKTLKKLVYKERFLYNYCLRNKEEVAEHQFNIINYLIENVFSNGASGSGMLSNNIKHFKFSLEFPNKLKLIFESLFKHYNYFQLYSITIVIYETLYEELLNEIINLSNKISKVQQQQQQQQQQSIKEFKIVINKKINNKHFQTILNDRNINGDNGLFVITVSNKKRLC
ncbi:hypothetical protein DDB_G0277447 [Dictyostelium discoideum AX4]|uniref:Uncharacterized protein n=1 Tax=Dictyostelium discoideum TaxID=44689 RepID=Q8MN59_DICDI|nr:hypothetical protein DDB_G0277447 [Dictyostelium discoideum AX4]EAL68686.1 hypothetical protein DDB_G0277447 [Dictyostelium discoideum AX4]|eukprot:XP_642648.1 hypothetical protein DDB_G0277447 [Dictyostelium discoideum AX4]